MPAAGWERRWRGNRRAEDRDTTVLAGASGEALDSLVHLGARALLSVAGADRAGLWLSASRRGEPGAAAVVEAGARSVPEEWKALDFSAPFARAALENLGPLRLERVADEVGRGGGAHADMQSAVWIPLRAGERTLGLGMVGYARPPGSVNAKELRVLAEEISLAVQQSLDFQRVDRTASQEILRKFISESRESLIVIDASGRILEASRPAARLLFAPWGPVDGTILEELFFPVARDAVCEWRSRLQLPASATAPRAEVRAPEFEAELERGGVLRLSLQCECAATGDDGPRWLLRLEEQGAQQRQREIEDRLEAELAGLLESIESGVLILDADGRILMASERLGGDFWNGIAPHSGIRHHPRADRQPGLSFCAPGGNRGALARARAAGR